MKIDIIFLYLKLPRNSTLTWNLITRKVLVNCPISRQRSTKFHLLSCAIWSSETITITYRNFAVSFFNPIWIILEPEQVQVMFYICLCLFSNHTSNLLNLKEKVYLIIRKAHIKSKVSDWEKLTDSIFVTRFPEFHFSLKSNSLKGFRWPLANRGQPGLTCCPPPFDVKSQFNNFPKFCLFLNSTLIIFWARASMFTI